jgi:hypothetical protein
VVRVQKATKHVFAHEVNHSAARADGRKKTGVCFRSELAYVVPAHSTTHLVYIRRVTREHLSAEMSFLSLLDGLACCSVRCVYSLHAYARLVL